MRHQLSLIAMSLVICGCFGESGDDTDKSPDPGPEAVSDLENEVGLPALDRSDDLAGPDNDGDGIRDDIERYINHHYAHGEEKRAARQFAKSARKVFQIDLSNLQSVKKINQQMTAATVCAHEAFKYSGSVETGAQVTTTIEALNANTQPRSKRYAEFAAALDGTTWSLPKGDGCVE